MEFQISLKIFKKIHLVVGKLEGRKHGIEILDYSKPLVQQYISCHKNTFLTGSDGNLAGISNLLYGKFLPNGKSSIINNRCSETIPSKVWLLDSGVIYI